MSLGACSQRGAVDAHFAGTIGPHGERELRAHLSSCEECRERYRRHLLFSKLDPEALPPAARIALGLGLRRPRSPRLRVVLAAGLILAVAAAFTLLLRPPASDDGFVTRGAHQAGPVASTLLHVYRAAPLGQAGPPLPILDGLRRDDELAFAYENPERKPYLMIFAVDDTRRVYWFYPAWVAPEDDPAAIPVLANPGAHPLPEAVAHHFEGSSIHLHGLFLSVPTTVREIERLLAKTDGSKPLATAGGVDHVQRLQVSP